MDKQSDVLEAGDLTVTEIIRALGKNGADEKKTRSVLSRYLDNSETRALLGASSPIRPTYPCQSVPMIAALIEASERGQVTPKMGAVWLAKNFPAVPLSSKNYNTGSTGNPSTGEAEPESAATVSSSPPAHEAVQAVALAVAAAVGQAMVPTIAGAIREALVEVISVCEDRLMDSREASELLACRPRSVSRYVKPVRKGVYRRSDVMRHIGALSPRV